MLATSRPLAPFPFTAADGTHWDVYDFSVRQRPDGSYHRIRFPIGSERAEYRAFKSASRVLCYRFGLIAYRDPEPRFLEDQLRFAKDIRLAGAGVAGSPLPNPAQH